MYAYRKIQDVTQSVPLTTVLYPGPYLTALRT